MLGDVSEGVRDHVANALQILAFIDRNDTASVLVGLDTAKRRLTLALGILDQPRPTVCAWCGGPLEVCKGKH